MALGIAQTESWNGVSWIPKLASEPWISRIERDREEDVLAEEQADIVGRRRHRLDPFGRALVELTVLLLRGRNRHRGNQRPHRLRMARHGS